MPEETKASIPETISDEQLDKMAKTVEQMEAILASSKDLGPLLVQEAKKTYNDERQKKVVGEVKRLFECVDSSKAAISLYTKSLQWYTRKLAAIQAGEFEFDERGQMFMNEEDLRRANY
jgi:hypothetical protein